MELSSFYRIKDTITRLLRTGIQMLFSWLRWRYVQLITIRLKQVCHPSIDDLNVLYKSDGFIVVNKQPYIKINSDDAADTVTVATQIAKRYPDSVDEKKAHGFSFIHRLDFSTSGVLCVALSKKSSRWGHLAFQKKYITKHYIALVRGYISEENMTVDSAVGDDSSVLDINKMCTEDNENCINPRAAKTCLYLMEHGLYDGQAACKILLIPHTGRTHQLRVHCASIGHQIVGDYTYSNRTDIYPSRMMLHAHRLIIPMKREHIDCMAPDPFTTDQDSKWLPTRIFSTYTELVEQYKLLRPQDRNIPCGVKDLPVVVSKKGKRKQHSVSCSLDTDKDCISDISNKTFINIDPKCSTTKE